MKWLRQLGRWVLCGALILSAIGAPLTAGAVEIDDSSVFLKQEPDSVTCTLMASTMMLRRYAILNNRADWTSITAEAVGEVAWGSGLAHNFTYSGAKVTTQGLKSAGYTTTAAKKAYFISLLESHPEGIVIYNHKKPHAVLLTDYDRAADTFYCADSNPGYPSGRIALSRCSIPGSGQTEKIGNINQIWYIKGSTAAAPTLQVTARSSGSWQVTVPGYYKLYCYAQPDATRSATYVAARTAPYTIQCTQKADLSSGKTRYFFVSGDGKSLWFDYTPSMSLGSGTTAPKEYVVTFDANGGSVGQKTKTVVSGTSYGALPTPTRTGYEFAGWFTAQSGGTQITEGTRVELSGNLTLYAHWTGAAGQLPGYTMISTPQQLAAIGSDPGGSYALAGDLDLGGASFQPIGTEEAPFTGTFDGNGHTITGLSIRGTADGVGLFGHVSGGTVKNLTIDHGTVTADGVKYVGMCVGKVTDGAVSNCTVRGGSVTVAGRTIFTSVGGVVGQAVRSQVTMCANSAAVTGPEHVGGVVGALNQAGSAATYCYNAGTVTATDDTAGGVVGATTFASYSAQSGEILCCYNAGAVSAPQYAGGIVGHANYSGIIDCGNVGRVDAESTAGGLAGIFVSGAAEHCFSWGAVSAGQSAGGLFGSLQRDPDIAGCYYDGKIQAFYGDLYQVDNPGGAEVATDPDTLTGLLNAGRTVWRAGAKAPEIAALDGLRATVGSA